MLENNKLNYYKYYLYIIMSLFYFGYYFSPYNYQIEVFKEYFKLDKIYIDYLNGFIAFIFVLGFLGLTTRYLHNLIKKLKFKDTDNDIILGFLLDFINTNKYFIQVYVFFIFIDVHENIGVYINKIFYIIFLLIFIFYFTSFLNYAFENILIRHGRFKTLNKSLTGFLKKILIITVWIIGVITVLSNLGYNVSAFITGAGIGGLAIALAAQKTLGNVFGAVTIILTKPFKIGDYIGVDGQKGTVKEVGLFHLIMLDKQGYQVCIPNEKLVSNNIKNFSEREMRRTELLVKINQNTSLKKVKEAIKIIENILLMYKENNTISSYRVGFEGFGDFALDIRIVYSSLITDDYIKYIKQKEKINLEIKNEFEINNIKIAFPSRNFLSGMSNKNIK